MTKVVKNKRTPLADEAAKIKILTQGAILISHAYMYQEGENVCAIAVDMRTKRADIFSTGNDENNCPTISIEANECSQPLKKGIDRTMPTEISFPKYKDWNIWSAEVIKYTIHICLVKNIKNN